MSWQGGWVVSTLGVAAPLTKSNRAGTFDDVDTIEEIERWMHQVVEAVGGSGEHRAASVAATVVSYGIDTARFGTFE